MAICSEGLHKDFIWRKYGLLRQRYSAFYGIQADVPPTVGWKHADNAVKLSGTALDSPVSLTGFTESNIWSFLAKGKVQRYLVTEEKATLIFPTLVLYSQPKILAEYCQTENTGSSITGQRMGLAKTRLACKIPKLDQMVVTYQNSPPCSTELL